VTRMSGERVRKERKIKDGAENPDPSHESGRIRHPRPTAFGKGCATRHAQESGEEWVGALAAEVNVECVCGV